MIQSMTAFARAQIQGNYGSILCECRSINHRYLELSLRLPDVFHELEGRMRERVRQHIQRGKVECLVRYQPANAADTDMTVNHDLLKKLLHTHESIAALLKNPAPINPTHLLQWPGVLQMPEADISSIQEQVLAVLETTLLDLVQARYREGKTLQQLLLQRLDAMVLELEKVRVRLPDILRGQRERLLTRFTEANVSCDSLRLEQELVLYAQKIDISEELDRIETHIAEVRRILAKGEAMGRRLDFLMQELNREANTLGSKSVDSETTKASVELKVLIEQMREQVQNIE